MSRPKSQPRKAWLQTSDSMGLNNKSAGAKAFLSLLFYENYYMDYQCIQ